MADDELSGRTLGEFVLRERIGKGGFGTVYRAEQLLLGREAVIKVLRHELRDNDTAPQRFLREAQLASRLDHPYAAHIYAFGVEQDDGLLWIAMEMVRGTPFDRWLSDRGPLPVDRLVPFFERIAEVVHTAHEHGIVHRDLKPSNMMVIERAGRLLPKLLDFGIARLVGNEPEPGRGVPPPAVDAAIGVADTAMLDGIADTAMPSDAIADTGATPIDSPTRDASAVPGVTASLEDGPRMLWARASRGVVQETSASARLTQAGAAIGSPPYMAPEQWQDAWRAGPAADIYSLGVVAYEALTGRRPFVATTAHAFMIAHLEGKVPPVGHGFPATLDAFFERALAKRPEQRPATALALAADLRVACGQSDTAVAPQLDADVRDAWLADGPQPIAESIATLEGARNAHQARDAAWDLARGVIRYLVAIALAARAQVRIDEDVPTRELLRDLRRRDLADDERIRILRLSVAPFASRRTAYPIPELVDRIALSPDPIDRLLEMAAANAGAALAEDQVHGHLVQLVPTVSALLRSVAFLLDYPLLVARNDVVERWLGLRRPRRLLATVRDHRPSDGCPVLVDRDGNIVVELWPLAQISAPSFGADDELFLFDGRGRHGARLVAAPAGFVHHDGQFWEWYAEHVIGDAEVGTTDADEDRPPFLGLQTFSASDADRFVGRESEIDAFVNRLRVQALQILVGASGAGKSSFVFAGVVPALPSSWRVVSLRPGATPVATLVAKLATVGVSSVDLEHSPAAAHATITTGELVIVVDQLEELFTICPNEQERTRFAAMLAQLSSIADGPLHVIGTIRDDFLMRLEALAPLRTRVSTAMTLLGNPSRNDLARTVIEPARRAGYELSDPDLARDMVDAVAERPGALALLSFTASRLWELRDRRFKQLTRKAYDAMGGVGGALGKHAEATLESLPRDDQRLVREAFRHLVTADLTRAVLSPTELRQVLDSDRADAVIEKLVAARLLVVVEGEGEPRAELAHEALIAAWPRLQQWIREDAEGSRMRDQLRAAAKQWDARDRNSSLLWRGDALTELERWRARHHGALTDVEAAFANASSLDASRARRRRRAALGMVVGVLAVAVIVLVWARGQAASQRELALRYAARAEASDKESRRRLAEQYEDLGRNALLSDRAGPALLYFMAAIDQGAPRDRALDFMISSAVHAVERRGVLLRAHSGPITSIELADNARMVTASDDGTSRVWDLATNTVVGKLQTTTANLHVALLDRAGTRLLTWGLDGVARVFTSSGTLLHHLRVPDQIVADQLFRPGSLQDGELVVVPHPDGRVRIWSSITGEVVRMIETELSMVRQVRVSPDERWVLLSDGSSRLEARDPATGKLLARIDAGGMVSVAAISPSGKWLAVTTWGSRDVEIWDTRDRRGFRRVGKLQGHGDLVEHITFNADDTVVATASRDRTGRLWDVASLRLLITLQGHSAKVTHCAFDGASRRIVTASSDGTARIWSRDTGVQLATLEADGTGIVTARFVGDEIVTGDMAGLVRRWRVDVLATLPRYSGSVHTLSYSQTGDKLLTGAGNTVDVWDVRARTRTSTYEVRCEYHCAAFARDGIAVMVPDGILIEQGELRRLDVRGVGTSLYYPSETVLVAVIDGVARVLTNGHVAATLTGKTPIATVATSPTGDRVAVAGQDGAVHVWDARVRRSFELDHTSPINTLALAPANELLATGGTDGFVRFWSTQGAKLVRSQSAHRGAVFSMAFDHKERATRLATAGFDGVIRIWDLDPPSPDTPPVVLEGHVGLVISVTFDPTGDFVVSGGVDQTVRIWDSQTGRLLATRRPHSLGVVFIAMRPDGHQVASASHDGTVVLHDLDVQFHTRESFDTFTRCIPFALDGTQLRAVDPEC